MLELKNITKIYKSQNNSLKALDDISLNFKDKEFVSILGPSGCGKTTLLNILGGLDSYNEGSLIIDDVDTKDYKEKDWDKYRNDNVGFVFQHFNLIGHLTVLKNVEVSLTLSGYSKKERKEKAIKALEKVGLLKHINKLPKHLSGGEKQRVAIARAIVNEPKIILADEPTGALDSKTSVEILNILKDISSECLVVMVTHNQELAENYSTRIIKLLDGKIISDENKENYETNNTFKIMKKHKRMPFFTALSISFKNLKTKWTRTLLTTLAGSIGIIGVSLVISVANGVTNYIEDVQRVALGNYPITISSSVKSEPSVSIYDDLEEYPVDEKINIVMGESRYEHLNVIENEFFDYLDQVDSDLYTWINYNNKITLDILCMGDKTYRKVSTSYLQEMTEDIEIVSNDYDVLKGKIPESKEEIALVVDSYNCIGATLLYYMGIDYDRESISFDELLEEEFKLITSDEFYLKVDGRYYKKGSSYYETLYNESKVTLKIVGILRAKKNATTEPYSSTFLYTKELTDYVYDKNINSPVVKEQIEYGLTKNVFTNSPFEEYVGLNYTESAQYQYEVLLRDLGAIKQRNRVYIYTKNFSDRLLVEEHIDNYNNPNSFVRISYSDYMKRITEEFSTFVDILGKVLIIFASISLLVSSIMIGIISYISVLERIEEIGILRSIGASRTDIGRIFVAETMIVGLLSGVFGIAGAFLLSNPIGNIVKKIIQDNASVTTGLSSFRIVQFEVEHLVIILIGSILLTVVAGILPTIYASFIKPIKALKNDES